MQFRGHVHASPQFGQGEGETARPSGTGARLRGCPECAKVVAGFLGIPHGERSPETCASCPGPGGWMGLLVGGKKQFWLLVGPWSAPWGATGHRHGALRGCSCRWSRTPCGQGAQSHPDLSAVGLGQPLCLNISSQHVMRAVCEPSFRTTSELPGAEGVGAREAAGFRPASTIPVLPSTRSHGNLPLAVPRPAGRDVHRPYRSRGVRDQMAVPPGKTEQRRPTRPTASRGSRAFGPGLRGHPASWTWGSVCGLGAPGGPVSQFDARETMQKDMGNHPPC